MKYRWALRPVSQPDAVRALQSELEDLPEPLARTLVLRGVNTKEEARKFFRPGLEDLHDPFLMKDMDRAADRLLRAIRNSEKVLVYGDYDVDGTTSTAMMIRFLRKEGVETDFYIPQRYIDGYGLGEKGIDYAAAEDVDLVISVDCGINAHEAASYLKSKGMDLIVSDHHTADESLPEAVAVIDPKRPDCHYPFKGLSGCGVGFKLIQATLQRMGRPVEEAYEYLDLVALSIAGDIVPILDENRMMMYAGLKQIRQNPRAGLLQLSKRIGINLDQCTTSRIVFGLGPRINAAGRMGNAALAVRMLIEDDLQAADEQASRLESLNHDRRLLDQRTFDEAVQLMEETSDTCMQHAIVLHQPEWHLGVIGIVASRLVEKFNRPAIMLGSVNGWAKGSARSIDGYKIYDAIKECDSLLTQFGGHDYAAGVVLPEENVPAFRERLNQIVNETLTSEELKPEIHIDARLHLGEVTTGFWRFLRKMAPFGPENMTPVFWGKGLKVVGHPTLVGRGGHLKFRVRQMTGPSETFDVIGFGLHELFPVVRDSVMSGTPIQMLYSVELNHYNGKKKLQLRARDLRRFDA